MMFDTDVIIDALRGDRQAVKTITDEKTERLVATATWLELLQGVRNKREMEELRALFARLRLAVSPLTESIGVRAALLLEKHALADGLQAFDALVAATALEGDRELLTWNRKHFKSVTGLKLQN